MEFLDKTCQVTTSKDVRVTRSEGLVAGQLALEGFEDLFSLRSADQFNGYWVL
jgi:hypothetical protein